MPQIRANGIDIEFESFGLTHHPSVLLVAGVILDFNRSTARAISAFVASSTTSTSNPWRRIAYARPLRR